MASKRSTMTSVDTFLGLTSLGAKPDMEQVNNAIKMDDAYEVVRMFCEANGMGREDFTASFVAPHEYSFRLTRSTQQANHHRGPQRKGGWGGRSAIFTCGVKYFQNQIRLSLVLIRLVIFL